MTRLQALEAMLDQVEAGEWDFRHDAPARLVFPYHSASADDLGLAARAAFEGSLDAAKDLHDAVLPGWAYFIYSQNYLTPLDGVPHQSNVIVNKGRGGIDLMVNRGEADTPARAWLIAILKALIAEEQGQ